MAEQRKRSSSFDEISRVVEKKSGKEALLCRYHVGKPLDADYEISDRILGEGLSGGVRLAVRRDLPSQRVAVKSLSMANVSTRKRENILSEVAIHLCMDHPHVAQLHEVYECGDTLELAMECLEGGELFDRVKKMGRLNEEESANVTRQLLLAINYMHSQGIAHRDLKLENIMFVSDDSKHLKLIDFGFSKLRRSHDQKMKTDCGTLSYLAPEVLEREYTNQCDIWSIGVIVYILLSGTMPFYGSDEEQIKKIKHGSYAMKADRWKRISHEAHAFVQALMKTDPKERLTAQQALRHPWLETWSPTTKVQINSSMINTLCLHQASPRFRRCCRKILARMLPKEQQAKAYTLFTSMDTAQTGKVALQGLLQSWNIDDSVTDFDAETLKEHTLEYSDILAALLTCDLHVSNELLVSAFKKFAHESFGQITWSWLSEVFGESHEDLRANVFAQEADLTKDGIMSLEDFEECVRGSGEQADIVHLEPSTLSLSPSPSAELGDSPSFTSTPGSTATSITTAVPAPLGGHLRSSCRGLSHLDVTPSSVIASDRTLISESIHSGSPILANCSTPMKDNLRASCRGLDQYIANAVSTQYPVLLPLRDRQAQSERRDLISPCHLKAHSPALWNEKDDCSVVDQKAVEVDFDVARVRGARGGGHEQCICTLM
jgi:calcium-dependent protein kinase